MKEVNNETNISIILIVITLSGCTRGCESMDRLVEGNAHYRVVLPKLKNKSEK